MLLINCKAELKLKWTKHYVLAPAGVDITNSNYNIIFTINDTKNNQKLLKLLSKEYKTKSENKSTTKEYIYFESNFLVVNRLFVLAYSNQDCNSRRYKALSYHLPEGTIQNCNVIRTFMTNPSILI